MISLGGLALTNMLFMMALLSAVALVHVQAQDNSKCPGADNYSDGFSVSIWDHVYLRVSGSTVIYSCQNWNAIEPRTGLNEHGPDNIFRVYNRYCSVSSEWTFTANIFEITDNWRDSRPIKVIPVSTEAIQSNYKQLMTVLCQWNDHIWQG